MKPRALLINPPIYDFALYDLFLKPYGLLRISRWLKESGWDAKVLNCLDYTDRESEKLLGKVQRRTNGTGKFFRQRIDYPEGIQNIPRSFSRYGITRDSFRQKLKDQQPDIIFISTGMTYWYKGVQEAINLCREAFPGTPIIAGGVYASLMPEHMRSIMAPDLIIPGDDLSSLCTFLKKMGLPVPEQPFPEYPEEGWNGWKDAGVIQLNTGCPYSCQYCASNILCPQFVSGSPEKGFAYFQKIHEKFRTKNWAFYDDALLINKEKVFLPFIENLIEANIDANFYLPNAIHLRFLDEPTIKLMLRAGFQELRIGYESAEDGFHQQYDAKLEAEMLPEKVEDMKNAGFRVQNAAVYVIAGLPGQRAEEVETTIRAAAATGVRVRIAQYSPVPGTPLWEESCSFSQYPLKNEPLYHNNTFFATEWEGFTRADLEKLKQLTLRLYENKSM
ncbi:MAG: B12-binding domain-containing radical SAM protein [Spirochaetia bacterium]